MFTIYKLRANHVVDFAAEELKKYLRMMMPRCGEIDIRYDPQAKEGFRLGLMQDFGLPNAAEDPVLDDIVHIDADNNGGILAGSNPRSVLFAVYRYLKLNGCRWLYPGIDGEHIPMQNIAPQKYHHQASFRFRGHCNEGAEFQNCMLETIDFYAKQECNVYMIEFDNPYAYYADYYNHEMNTANRTPEPITMDQALQWKRQCEVEIAKRGLQFHDMGHGWTAEPFGLNSSDGWKSHNVELTPEQQEYVALVNGKRALYKGIALNTNLCMSNPKVRSIMVKSIVDYAKASQNVSYLHVWLSDGVRNHCECEECVKLNPTDYYLMIMNELDEALTAEGLDTRIVFIFYKDTMWAPLETSIKNPQRFSMLYAPIYRSYSSSVTEGKLPEAPEYIRNKWTNPPNGEDYLALLQIWQKNWKGPVFGYEYHFWRHQYSDPSQLYLARRIYEDIRALPYMGLDGYVEDGSQRSFFPNGLAMHIYAETLLNKDADFDALVEDYYRHAYGEDWTLAKKYMERVEEAFDFSYMQGEKSASGIRGGYTMNSPGVAVAYNNPAMAEKFAKAPEIAASGRLLASTHRAMPTRPQVISWRLLQLHTEYIEGLGKIMGQKCLGNDCYADELFTEFVDRFGRHEYEIERYFDQTLAFRTFVVKLSPAKRALLQPDFG